MRSIHLRWRVDERINSDSLQIISNFDRIDHDHCWTARVELHDKYWGGKVRAGTLSGWYGHYDLQAMERFHMTCEWQSDQPLSDTLAIALAQAMCAIPSQEHKMWCADDLNFRQIELRDVSVIQQQDRSQNERPKVLTTGYTALHTPAYPWVESFKTDCWR